MTAIDTTEAPAEAPPDLSSTERSLVLGAMCMALVLVIAGVTMLVNALQLIAEDLSLSQAQQAWVVDAYALPFAALLLIAGALGDRYGRRGALLTGSAIFGAASLLSATAGSGGQLLGYRALAGVGAALIMPGTLSTITSVFPADQRARAVGVWSGFAMGGGTLGMLGSGLLLKYFWWGSVFVVATVLAVAAFVAIAVAVPSTRAEEHVSLDPGGTVLSAIGVGGLVLGIIEGPEQGWFGPVTLGGLGIGVAALVGFVLWELRVDHPLLDPRLFKLRGFGTGSAALFVMFLAMFGFMLVSLQFLQLILGYSPLGAAVAMLPQMLVMIPLAAAAATLSVRYGQRRMTALGLLVSGVGMLWFTTLTAESTYLQFFVGMMVLSVGMGLAMTPATAAIVNSLPRAKQGVASAVNDTAREVGAALGVAVLGSAFNTAYRNDITPHLGGVPPEVAEGAREAPTMALDAARSLGSGGAELTAAAQHAFESGMRAAVVLSALLMGLGAAYTWWRGEDAVAPAPLADPDSEADADSEAGSDSEADLVAADVILPAAPRVDAALASCSD